MGDLLCPQLIGRGPERAALVAALDAARAGNGTTTVLVGEAGIGKSRLEREIADVARRHGMAVFAGRAVDGAMTALRPYAEALQSALRVRDLPDMPEAYRAALGRLVPSSRPQHGQSFEFSVVLLGEAVLQLVRALAPAAGVVLVLSDLHWADPETLALTEYLADNLTAEPVAVLASTRPGPDRAAPALAHALATRRAATVIELGRLSDRDVEQMAQACLGGAPPDVVGQLQSCAEGVPLLVEEILAAWASSGVLIREGAGWRAQRYVAPVVPLTFRDSVRRRLQVLPNAAHEILRAAALLGRRFDWTLLAPATGHPPATVAAALRQAADNQLLAGGPDEIHFRHSLTRDAILVELLPPERAALAERLLAALTAADPDLSGENTRLAADLAEAAGDRRRAATLLLTTGRAQTAAGTLATAAATLSRAATLAAGHPDRADLAADIGEVRTEVLALAGRTEEATTVGRQLLADLAVTGDPAARRGRALLGLARAAMISGQPDPAAALVATAERLAASIGDQRLRVRTAALAAHVALAQLDPERSTARAAAALAGATRSNLPEVACEALEALGRCARLHDLTAAEAAFQQAFEVADRHRLALWRVRALHELGTIDLLRAHRHDRLATARQAALAMGALATATVIDLHIAKACLGRFDPAGALDAATRCEAASRRYGLDTVAPAIGTQACAYAQLDDEARMDERIATALRISPDDADLRALIHGQSRAYLWLVRDDLPRARAELDVAMTHIRRRGPGPTRPFQGMWALLQVLDGADQPTPADLGTAGSAVELAVAGYQSYAAAVQHGRAGHATAAVSAFVAADELIAERDWYRHHAHRLIAEAAFTDGWGEPTAWLREAITYFDTTGYNQIAAACRTLLRRAGAAVPRRSDSRSPVPPQLRALGVSAREMDVLTLIAEGLSNNEIAARLFLSPKTVERHITNLLTKTGTRNRTHLLSVIGNRTTHY